jgi:hypothetical protein
MYRKIKLKKKRKKKNGHSCQQHLPHHLTKINLTKLIKTTNRSSIQLKVTQSSTNSTKEARTTTIIMNLTKNRAANLLSQIT